MTSGEPHTGAVTGANSVRPSPDSGVEPAPIMIPPNASIALCSTVGLQSAAFSSRKGFNLPGFAELLNSRQGVFAFTAFDQQWDLGPYDKLHIYTDEHYYERLCGIKQEQRGFDYAIAITSDDLERSVFNTHDEERGVGIITVSHYWDYIPPGGSLQRYLAFLVLCETLCLVGRYQFEHSRPAYCLFDMCRNKRDLSLCLTRPKIEPACEKELRTAGFRDEHLDAATAILTYVGTPSLPQIAISGIREPGAGFMLGVATTLGTAVLITVAVTAAEIVLAISAFLWLGGLYFIALRDRPKASKRAGRLRRLRNLLSRA